MEIVHLIIILLIMLAQEKYLSACLGQQCVPGTGPG